MSISHWIVISLHTHTGMDQLVVVSYYQQKWPMLLPQLEHVILDYRVMSLSLMSFGVHMVRKNTYPHLGMPKPVIYAKM